MNMYNKLYTLLDIVPCKCKSPVKNRFYQGFLVISIFLLLVLQSSCKNEPPPVVPDPEIIPEIEDKQEFGIYLLQDSSKKIDNIKNMSIDSLKIREKAFISKEDIDFYDYSSHCIYLKKSKEEIFAYHNPLFPFGNKSLDDKPFIIIGSKMNCSIGYFHNPLLSSNYWYYPLINSKDIYYYPTDIIYLSWPFAFTQDPRKNESVKKVIQEYNLFHAGIEAELISLKITRSGKVSLEYGIRITNRDKDNLYVLDPEKTGNNLFNYFNGTPTLLDTMTNKMYSTDNKSYTPSKYLGECDPLWFTRLETGQYIERVVTQSGYEGIPDGVFYCSLTYGGTVYQVEKAVRTLPDGRIWIGVNESAYIVVIKNTTITAKRNGKNSITGRVIIKKYGDSGL